MSDITVTYKGSTIATMDATGSKTLTTAGKYCEDDIGIAYVKPSGTVSQPSRDVNFFDYDGTIVASYSAADFASLSAMPANPTHDGLTAQGWNWTLADAKAQVALTGFLDIGQTYTTSDGKTRLYITLSEGRLQLRVYWSQTVSNGVTIDWGDGSTPEKVSGTSTKNLLHTYSSDGDYVITFTVTSGTMLIGGTGSSSAVVTGDPINYYRNTLRKVEIGSNAGLNSYAFYSLFSLESVSVPNTLTQFGSFYGCYGLKYVTIPSGLTDASMYRNCYTLQYISIPKSATTLSGSQFRATQCLRRIFIPSVASIPADFCNTSTALTVVYIPSTVTSIGDTAFKDCSGMIAYHVKATTPPTLGTTVFTGIHTQCKIYVPSASLSAYQSAWSAYSSYLVGE